MKRLGVLGWPVGHSRSPAMQRAGLVACGLSDWTYQLLPVPPELLVETVRGLPGSGFVGANVTLPHKVAALKLADEASLAARAIGAANTLSFGADGTVRAENTDAPGLLDALPVDPAGRTALVLGAGGSARAAVWGLREAGADVAVWNRTASRAEALAEEFGVRSVDAEGVQEADLLVNCTTVGLDVRTSRDVEGLTDLPVSSDSIRRYACVVDLVYGSAPTALVAAARTAGLEVVDGLEILVRQGARSFTLWTGRAAPLDTMRAAAAG